MTKPNIGTISHGTLRTQDLLASFCEAYKQYCADEPGYDRSIADEMDDLINSVNEADRFYSDPGLAHQYADDILERLQDALDVVAEKHGMYFGVTEGDGSDYGFWPIPPDDQLLSWQELEEIEDAGGLN